ncbi:ATP-binding protein [Tepidibacter hydrothermalis]|uniref:histidine kinase n=1 Tax=Tepidibacter hydrothermalis TaxID=3036126 RepID=A0ABY8E9U5_9FIRM|nr:ATP-binding protein [Tepidibacter hydrothermalis]WFD09686.1 ATP-binding protein [Tepidibacter hydrothermalis]
MVLSFFHNMLIYIGFIYICIKLNEYILKKIKHKKARIAIRSVLASILSILSMTHPFKHSGMNFDLRNIPIFFISYVYGWKAGIISVVLPSLFRWYIGGYTIKQGIVSSIMIPMIVGSFFYKIEKKEFINSAILDSKKIIRTYLIYNTIKFTYMIFNMPLNYNWTFMISINIMFFGIVALYCMILMINDYKKKLLMMNEMNEKQEKIKVLNENLKSINDTLYKLIDVMPVGVIVIGAKGKCKLINAIASDLVYDEINNEECDLEKRYPFLYRMNGSKIDIKEHPLFQSIKNGKVIKNEEILIRKKNKDEKIILMSSTPVYDCKGSIIKGIGVFNDITKIKEDEKLKNQYIKELSDERKKLKKKNSQLIHLSKKYMSTLDMISQKNEDLKVANEAKNNFIANISHELKTPLNITMTYLEYLLEEQEGNLNIQQKEIMEIAYKNAERLEYLINDLLDFSILETEKWKFKFKKIDLNELINTLIKERKLFMKNNKTDIIFNNNQKNIVVITDPLRLRQVIDNILDNAIKFSNEGNIKVFIEKEEDIHIFIKDCGIGIDQDKIEEIFEPFYQIDNSYKKKYKGVGLGLSIAKKIIEEFSGSISVNNNVDKGCTFKITIPYDCLGEEENDEKNSYCG